MTARILVTGAGGYLGRQVIERLAAIAGAQAPAAIVAMDIRAPASRRAGVDYEVADIRSPELAAILRRHAIEVVVHLASIVTPGRDSSRAFEYDVDVNGTRNLLEACVRERVRRVIVSSSGAAYGYHADNAAWLTEDMKLRGNEAFAYSHHKRLVEEMLAEYRELSPGLEQVVLRIGTILGATVRNQITDLFEKPRLLAIAGSDSPFVFIWDQDVVGVIIRAIQDGPPGIFNVAGDGALTIHQIAARLGKSCLILPAWLLGGALAVLKPLGLTQYDPEQLDFLRYRPVLDNAKLKSEFGYMPRYSSSEVFDLYRRTRMGGAEPEAKS
ncbi:SDR family oxidoreductase [Bradyrhizobium sp.]|uniref:SDR family oxidoreductase n=1 Tax=Bradyrhizobium sp. TaxID=376 RepID=UPI00239FC4AF|nr:SDR family oxidoreductase [Bradyrhizobium sp.]MDE2378203.1 SDR family oxidoreductase [Bradyrhizobium sp.]